jgi:hypothetical protein
MEEEDDEKKKEYTPPEIQYLGTLNDTMDEYFVSVIVGN